MISSHAGHSQDACIMEDQTPWHLPHPINHTRASDVLLQALPAHPSRASQAGKNSLAVFPRRPKKARGSLGWDPTVDIYDDTFAFQRPQAGQTRGEDAEKANHQSAGQDSTVTEFAKPSIPLTQPHRRYTTETGSSNAANVRIRRSSPSNPNQDLRTEDEIKRQARRRTIYVPSDDTSILTIHPGASLSVRNSKPVRPRRSDIFLDLATLSESNEVQQQNTPKRPLAVAPRRPPLQLSRRQLQITTVSEDILGSGGGKENIPPRMMLNGKKFQEQSFISPRRDTYQRPTVTSIAHSASSTPAKSPLSRSLMESPRRSPPVSLPRYDQNLARSSPLRQHQAFSDGDKRQCLLSTKNVNSKSNNQRTASSFSSPLRTSIHLDTSFQPLSFSKLSQNRVEHTKPYPLLIEDISNPELYETNWLNHQETALTAMLNSLLENAGHCTAKHAVNLSSLRTSLINLHSNEENVLLHKRLQASLRFGALSISADTLSRVGRFKDDLAQRQKLLDLWLKTYDLTVLQAAAEVIIGREALNRNLRVSSSPNFRNSRDSPGRKSSSLEIFLRMFLLRNEDVSAKNAAFTSPSSGKATTDDADDTGTTAWAWRRTVTRSLMLILLLDKSAKTTSVQKNLFQTSSLYKSSAAVLQGLSSILLPSIGDTSRVLHHLSYSVSYVQHPLQEYMYHIKNLAIDLRDGVLLTRLVETLLYRNLDIKTTTASLLPTTALYSITSHSGPDATCPISTRLKYPVLSRAQKLHNVQIALNALVDVPGTESVLATTTARDIVDGHREKTVALLWALVEKLGLAALVDASLIEAEIEGLCREDAATQAEGSATQKKDCQDGSQTSASYDILLLSWARLVCARHGVAVSNLSTSFADGRAYAAILAVYSTCPSVNPATNFTSTSSTTSTTTARTSNAVPSDSASKSMAQTLRKWNIPMSILPLISSPTAAAAAPMIPSPRTTVALLAVLAGRLLRCS